jgi:hypothetical protein
MLGADNGAIAELEAPMTSKARASCLAATLLMLASAGTAQTRPDFSGVWTMDEARSVSATQDGHVGPVAWHISQTPELLTVEIKRGPKSFTLVFTMYEKPPTAPAADKIPAYRGYWDGDKLVTETAQNIQGQTVTTKEVRSLQAEGREMLVERLVTVEHGYTFRGAKNYNTAKDIFVRQVR